MSWLASNRRKEAPAPSSAPPARALAPTPAPGGIQRQGYRIGNVALAVSFDAASELLDMGPIARVPNSPPWLLGLLNLHGHPIPVFDLAPVLGEEHDVYSQPMLLVLGHGDAMAAVQIDGVSMRVRFQEHARVERPKVPEPLAPFVQAVWADRDGMTQWIEIDATACFDDLAASIVHAERRLP